MLFYMCDCNCKDQLRNKCCCKKCDLNKKSECCCVCVTLSDVARWNAAAKAIADLDPQQIDLNDYVKKEDLDSLVQEYLDQQAYLKSIPECYETEQEVLALLNSDDGYVKKAESYTKIDINNLLQGYATISALSNYATIQALQNVGNTSVTGVSFDDSTSNLIITKGNGSSSSIHLVTDGNGQGAVIANESMELSVYCNTLSTETPDTPINGGYDFQNYIKILPIDPNTPPQYTWSFSTNGMTIDDTHTVWISKRRFNSKTQSEATWSTPIKYSAGNITTNNTYQTVTYDNSAVIVVYHKGTIQRVPEYDSQNVEVNHHYRSIAPAKPVGGVYDFTTRTLTTFPHTQGNVSDLWQDYTTSEQWTDPDSSQEDPTVIEYTWYFSLGQVQYNNGTTTITWSDPAVYGGDYCMAAYNMRFVAVDYSVLADNITLTTNELTTVAQHVTLSSQQLEVIAQNVTLTASQLAIIADQVVVDANITHFRGDVQATEFTVVKDNTYYTGTTGNVTKNIDIDQTLFSIAQNTARVYDPTSPATDVVLNIWNPGQLVGHATGTEEDGGGSKGTLSGNVIEYTVNPKKLAQSVTGTYSWAYHYIIDDEDSQNIDFDMRSSFCTTPKSTADSVITLPDPKTYVGCTINGSFETVVYPNMLEYGTKSGHGSTNNTAYGPSARSIMQKGIWYTDSSRSSTLIDFNNVHPLWYCVEEIGNTLTDYTQPELHTVHGSNPYNDLEDVPALRDIMEGEVPRITITDSSDYPFVRLNAVSDDSALLLGSYERTNSVVSLDTNFYKDLYYAYDNVFSLNNIHQPLLQYVFEDNVPTSNGSYDYDLIKELYEFGNQQVTKYTKIYIVPSVVGLKKILESKPLSFVATAKRVNTDHLTQAYTTTEKSCKFYYWDIVTTDFTIVAVYDNEVSIPGFTTHYPFEITSEQDISASHVQQSNLAWDYIISSPTKLASLLVEAQDSCALIKNYIPTLWALVENGVTAYTQNINV